MAPDALQPGELIPPGEIGEDHLGVSHIVDQIIDLIRAVEPGTAIGLFGAAGVGKTTIMGLLKKRQDELVGRGDDRKAPMTFVPVDASESGGAGFRRRLVLACARGLKRKTAPIERQLRGASSHSRVGLPNWPLLSLIALIPGILAAMVLVGLGVAALAAWLTGAEFADIANQFVLAMLFAPAIAAAAFGLLVKSLTTDWSLPAPASDDEFVRVFEDLFEDEDRLLVFVDEIDRSPPERIADTLDGLRTFFGSRHCVFVVAADRQTLEHSLSSWLGESTPEHAANPYYGAASAYLDKLFKYQLIVPPPRSDALYQYARRVTRGRAGVWESLNADDSRSRRVMNVLIPSHVASPRQVNSLLNGFALTWHLLKRREPWFDADRMDEVAKLVCLRSEFPLFAADLHVDPTLPELVLEAVPRAGSESRVDSQRRDRARAYAEGRLPVSIIPPDGRPGDDSGAAVEHELRRQQSRQLVAYLAKTSEVKGPAPAIIHAQTFQSELPAEIAEELSNAALKRDKRRLDEAIAGARAHAKREAKRAKEAGHGSVRKAERDAIDLLSRRARAAKRPEEEINAFRSLLYVVAACRRAVDDATAERVLSRTDLVRKTATSLDKKEMNALGLLEKQAGNGKLPEAPATR